MISRKKELKYGSRICTTFSKFVLFPQKPQTEKSLYVQNGLLYLGRTNKTDLL